MYIIYILILGLAAILFISNEEERLYKDTSEDYNDEGKIKVIPFSKTSHNYIRK